MNTLFKNAQILQLDAVGCFVYADVHIENNIIKKIGENLIDESFFDKIVDCKNKILMPGFINAHAHSSMVLFRNYKDDVSLEEWLFDNMLKLENHLTKDDVYWSSLLAIAEQVRGGITTFYDNYYFLEETAKAVIKTGSRAVLAVGNSIVMDNVMVAVSDTSAIVNLVNTLDNTSELITTMMNSHSVYTQDEASLSMISDIAAKLSKKVSIHISETLTEVGNCLTKTNLTPPQLLEEVGFLDRGCTVFHAVHVDKEDIALLAQYDSSVVTCPSSNLKLGSGFAPLLSLKNSGINIAIGTDGAASNNSLDMFKEMFLAANLQKAVLNDPACISAEDVLKYATENGAIALGLQKIGKIQEGYFADIILIDMNQPHLQPRNNDVSALVYSAKSSDVCLTMINGKIVYENGMFNIGEELATIYENCNQIISRLRKKVKINDSF